MKLKIAKLITQTGTNKMTVAALLWPNARKATRFVMIQKFTNADVISIRLDQLKALRDFFKTSDLNDLIDFEDEKPVTPA